MPQHYPNKIEGVVELAAEESMQGLADEIHLNFNTTPSSVPDCNNTAVSIDNSCKTHGYYSNLGFGSAIFALTKKFLIVSYSIAPVKNVQLNGEKNTLKNAISAMTVTKLTVESTILDPANLWNKLLQRGYGVRAVLFYTTFLGDGDSKILTTE